MATKLKTKEVKLSIPQANAFERLSSLIFLTAAGMERDEKLLKGLVTKKLARMTRIGSSLGFIRDVGQVSIVLVGSVEELAAHKASRTPPALPIKKTTRSRKK